jgi:hypothetical protein
MPKKTVLVKTAFPYQNCKSLSSISTLFRNETYSLQGGVIEEPILLAYDDASLVIRLPTFRTDMVSSSSRFFGTFGADYQ